MSVIWLVVIVLAAGSKLNVEKVCKENGYCFPKIVWTYWDYPLQSIPEDVEEMMNVTKKTLESINFTHYLLTEENVSNFLDMSTFPSYFENLSRNTQSGEHRLHYIPRADYLRVCLVAKYGGIWVDASTYVNSAKEIMYFVSQGLKANADLITYSTILMINFFGAPENSIMMNMYKKEFDLAYSDKNPMAYLEKAYAFVKKNRPSVSVGNVIGGAEHVLFNKLYLENLDLSKKKMKFLPARRSQNRLLLECRDIGEEVCINFRILHDPKVRKHAMVKVPHRARTGKKLNWYEGIPVSEVDDTKYQPTSVRVFSFLKKLLLINIVEALIVVVCIKMVLKKKKRIA